MRNDQWLLFWRRRTSGAAPRITYTIETVPEDASIGDLASTLGVANSPDGVTWTFSLDVGAPTEFEIDGVDNTRLEVADALDYETATSYSIPVIATPSVGSPIARTITINVTNVIDSIGAPAIVSLSPLDGAFGVSVNAPLIITFDLPIQLGDTVSIRLYKTAGDVLVQEWTESLWAVPGANALELLPDELDDDTDYYVQITSGSIESADEVPFTGIADETTWNFSTADAVPDAFEVGDWSIVAGNTVANVTINALPEDNGDTITDIEYRIDGGSAVSSGTDDTSGFTITSLVNDVEVDVEIRAVNSTGAGPWSDTKQVTPAGAEFITLVNGDRILLVNGTDKLLKAGF